MNRIVAVACVVLVGVASSTYAQDVAESGAGWRYESIDMTVRIEPDKRQLTIVGTAQMRLHAEASFGPTLLLRSNNGEDEKTTFAFVSLTGDGLDTSELNETFEPMAGVIQSSLRAHDVYQQGDIIEIAFAIQEEGARNQFVVDPKYATASWTSAWYPVPLPGSDESFGSGIMSTTGVVRFDVPDGWSTVSCGDMTSRTESGDRAIEEWTLADARAIGFAAGAFSSSVVQAGERTVGMFRLDSGDATVLAQAQALSDVIDAMSERFGEYPYTRFSIAEAPNQVPGFWAASEQGFILAKPDVFAAEGGNLPLFAHEAAHAWWGNLVGTDGVGGIFLSESLSQYGAVLAIETIEGEEAATDFLRFSRPEYISNQCARGYFKIIRDGDDKPIASIEHGGGVNHTISDAKGHWVHHMLRRRVGEEVYFGTLGELKDRFAGSSMTLDAFREAFVSAAPDARLEQFFAQWLDRTGAPVLEFDWKHVGDDAIEVTVLQLQDGEPFDLDIEFEMIGAGGDRVETATVSETEQTVRIAAPSGTNIVRLDPMHRILRWTPEYGPRP